MQLAALMLAVALLIGLKLTASIVYPVYAWAALTGVFAAMLSLWYRMDWWWVAIELLFAPALLAATTLPIPPVVSLVLFLVLLGIFWSTCQTQVPLFLSGPSVWHAVDMLLPPRPLRCIDIGSGLGGLVLALARRRPDCTLHGVEIAPLPWLISVLRARWRNSTARFSREDYRDLDFADYDVIFAYLSPAAMPALWQQAIQQMGDGSMLISYAFGLAATPPDEVIQLAGTNRQLFVWYPASHRRSTDDFKL